MSEPKAPITAWETWRELEQACEEVLETWNNETLLFFSRPDVEKANSLVAEQAKHVLEVRMANGEYEPDIGMPYHDTHAEKDGAR